MTPELVEYLKNNQQVINEGDFYTLFHECPSRIVPELYETLKPNTKISFTIPNDNPNNLYKFIYNSGSNRNKNFVLQIDKLSKGKNASPLYETSWIAEVNSNPEFYAYVKGLYSDVLDMVYSSYKWATPELVTDNSNNFNLVPIEHLVITGADVSGKFFITQECIDHFDPVKIKDRRIKDAAKEELNNLIYSHLNKINLNNLREIATKYYQGNDSNTELNVSRESNRIVVTISSYNASDVKDIIKDIKNEIKNKGSLIVMENPKYGSFIITLKPSVIKDLKDKIEDIFDVSLS